MSKFRRARRGWVTDYKTACYLREQWEYNLQRLFVIELVGHWLSDWWRVRPATKVETLRHMVILKKRINAPD